MRILCWLLWMIPTVLMAQRSYVVAQGHPKANDRHPGTERRPLATIGQAASLAQPGDTVLVYGGTYRERVAPARGGTAEHPIVYLAAPGEQVTVKASERWQPTWEAVPGQADVFFGSFASVNFTLKPAAPADQFPGAPTHYNPYLDTLAASPTGEVLSLGQVFVDGQPLTEVTDEATLYQLPGTWMLNQARDGAYVHFPAGQVAPTQRLIELTTRQRCFAPFQRGLAYLHVIGFTFEHGATNFPQSFWQENDSHPQAGIVSTRSGHHWRIEGCTIRLGKSIGLDIGNEGSGDADGLGQVRIKGAGHHQILGNVIADNGCGGIEGIGSTETRIIGNLIEGNNRLGFTAAEIGGIKLHVFERGVIADNLIRNNHGYGLWLDNIWTDTRVTRNAIIGNQGAGIFIELGQGPLMIDNNVIALTHNNMALNGDGVYSHDASGVTFAHNLIFENTNFGLWVHVATDRLRYQADEGIETETRVPCQASRWRIFNNMILSNHGGTIALPAVSDRSQDNQCDHNLLAGVYDALSSETYAMGLDQPSFRVLPNKGRINPDSLYQAISTTLGLSPSDNRQALPYLSLAEWQTFTGFDAHSQHPLVLRPTLSDNQLWFSFMIDDSPVAVEAIPLPGIERDFFGQAIGEQPLAGPFQSLNLLPTVEQILLPHRGPYNHVKSSRYPSNGCYLGRWPHQSFDDATLE
jgi:hypothetical protein